MIIVQISINRGFKMSVRIIVLMLYASTIIFFGIRGMVITLVMYIYVFSSPEAGTIGMLVSLAVNPILSLFTSKLATHK